MIFVGHWAGFNSAFGLPLGSCSPKILRTLDTAKTRGRAQTGLVRAWCGFMRPFLPGRKLSAAPSAGLESQWPSTARGSTRRAGVKSWSPPGVQTPEKGPVASIGVQIAFR